MSQVKWTDEAIENWLLVYTEIWNGGTYKPDDTEKLLHAAMLELKRMRAWAAHGIAIGAPQDQREALRNILSGDPAPTDEQEAT